MPFVFLSNPLSCVFRVYSGCFVYFSLFLAKIHCQPQSLLISKDVSSYPSLLLRHTSCKVCGWYWRSFNFRNSNEKHSLLCVMSYGSCCYSSLRQRSGVSSVCRSHDWVFLRYLPYSVAGIGMDTLFLNTLFLNMHDTSFPYPYFFLSHFSFTVASLTHRCASNIPLSDSPIFLCCECWSFHGVWVKCWW